MAENKTNETPKKTVKKTITKVESAKNTSSETPKYAPKAASSETAGNAKTKRIIAVVCWVIAIAFEVLALLEYPE